MNGVALRMLLGDRAKYMGLIFGIAFSTMLMSNQVSIFTRLMLRTASQISCRGSWADLYLDYCGHP
jgi:putative ABC transport system permease protein